MTARKPSRKRAGFAFLMEAALREFHDEKENAEEKENSEEGTLRI